MATITTRAGKGTPLTNTEVDNNFTNLNTDKYESGDNINVGTVTADGLTVNSAGFPTGVIKAKQDADTTRNRGILLEANANDSVLAIGYNSGKFSLSPTYNSTGSFEPLSVFTSNLERLTVETNGDISFYEDTGTTAKFFWDASAESLGIGTTSPSAKLEVSDTDGEIRITGTRGTDTTHRIHTGGTNSQALNITSGSTSGNAIYHNSTSHIFRNQTGATEYARIDSSGNVNVNGTVTADGLTVDGAGSFSTNLSIRTTSSPSGYNLHVSQDDSDKALAKFTNTTTGTTATDGFDVGLNATEEAIVWHQENKPIRFGTNSLDRLRIDADGDISFYEDTGATAKFFWDADAEALLLGTSTIRSNFFNTTVSPAFQFEGANASGGVSSRFMSQTFGQAGTNGPIFTFAKHRSNSVGGTTVVASGDELGQLVFQGSDGTEFLEAASIKGMVAGTPGANDMPGALVFSTTADGASSASERMRLNSDGSCRWTPDGTNADMTLDASGHLLVGKTSIGTANVGTEARANGLIQATRDGGNPLELNRKGSGGTENGTIIDLRSNGATVGSIGTKNSDLFIGTGDTGIRFADSVNSVYPHNTATNEALDATISLGAGGFRFKDLYLSGAAKVFGGTDARIILGKGDEGVDGHVKIQAIQTGADTDQLGIDFYTHPSAQGSLASSHAMRLDANSNLNVGTQSFSSAGTDTGLFVSGQYGVVNANFHGNDYFVWNIHTSGTNNRYLQFRWGNATVGSISTNGSTTTYATSSDYRLKENVVDMTGAVDRIKALNPSQFNFIADPDRTVDGFLAHEVADVVPEAVTGTKDAMRTEEYEVTPAVLDDDGNVVTEAVMGTREVPDYQGIDQSKLVPLLTGALQEAIARIETLEAEVATLKGN